MVGEGQGSRKNVGMTGRRDALITDPEVREIEVDVLIRIFLPEVALVQTAETFGITHIDRPVARSQDSAVLDDVRIGDNLGDIDRLESLQAE